LLQIHQAIYDAVAAGDATAARTAVLRHHEVMLAHLAAARGAGSSDPGEASSLPGEQVAACLG
jgi:DNA-binding FadR family transcriptional regulator